MTAPKELYTVLGVDESASDAEIRSAYNHLIADAPEGTPRRASIEQAYAVLSDMDRRAMYDVTGKVGHGVRRTRRADAYDRRAKARYTLNTIFLAGAAVAVICFVLHWSGAWSTTPFYWTCGAALLIKIAEYILRIIP